MEIGYQCTDPPFNVLHRDNQSLNSANPSRLIRAGASRSFKEKRRIWPWRRMWPAVRSTSTSVNGPGKVEGWLVCLNGWLLNGWEGSVRRWYSLLVVSLYCFHHLPRPGCWINTLIYAPCYPFLDKGKPAFEGVTERRERGLKEVS